MRYQGNLLCCPTVVRFTGYFTNTWQWGGWDPGIMHPMEVEFDNLDCHPLVTFFKEREKRCLLADYQHRKSFLETQNLWIENEDIVSFGGGGYQPKNEGEGLYWGSAVQVIPYEALAKGRLSKEKKVPKVNFCLGKFPQENKQFL